MKKSSKALIVLSCIFATIAALFLTGEALFIGVSFNALYKPDADLGDALGGIFVYIYAILLAIGAVASSIVSIPFESVLFKTVGKRWYNIVLLCVSIAILLAAIALVFTLPAYSAASSANSSSSSSIQ